MIFTRTLCTGLAALLLAACAPYPHNDYYDSYYGGYPYTNRTYLGYYGGYPYYHWRPWYDYPWYWHPGHDHDDDDDDHHHRPPHPPEGDRAEYLMRHRTDAADLEGEDLARYRERIRESNLNRYDRIPRGRDRGWSSISRSHRGVNRGGSHGGGRASRRILMPSVSRRGDQWQR